MRISRRDTHIAAIHTQVHKRPLVIEREARGCRAALVLEAAGPGGALKTERKGLSRYEVRVRGRAAHAGGADHPAAAPGGRELGGRGARGATGGGRTPGGARVRARG